MLLRRLAPLLTVTAIGEGEAGRAELGHATPIRFDLAPAAFERADALLLAADGVEKVGIRSLRRARKLGEFDESFDRRPRLGGPRVIDLAAIAADAFEFPFDLPYQRDTGWC